MRALASIAHPLAADDRSSRAQPAAKKPAQQGISCNRMSGGVGLVEESVALMRWMDLGVLQRIHIAAQRVFPAFDDVFLLAHQHPPFVAA
jgi:hypothetical protein